TAWPNGVVDPAIDRPITSSTRRRVAATTSPGRSSNPSPATQRAMMRECVSKNLPLPTESRYRYQNSDYAALAGGTRGALRRASIFARVARRGPAAGLHWGADPAMVSLRLRVFRNGLDGM